MHGECLVIAALVQQHAARQAGRRRTDSCLGQQTRNRPASSALGAGLAFCDWEIAVCPSPSPIVLRLLNKGPPTSSEICLPFPS